MWQGTGIRLIEFIGRGGMGSVYKGHQNLLDRIVAVKVLPPRAPDGGSIIFRFEREARLLARLNHPNIVAIYQFGLAGDFPYFTMDFVAGLTLRHMLKTGAMDPGQALALFLQMCDGLQHAHDNGVIHRDIKPENLLVDNKGCLKIADFGLAKLNVENVGSEWQTLEGRRLGTPHYMAPEQVEAPLVVNHRADIYAAGVVLYEMLTGGLPLGRFAPPSQTSQVNPALDEVLFKALEKDPGRRYQEIAEFKRAVELAFLIKSEPAAKRDLDQLEQRLRPIEKAAQENPDDPYNWEQLKDIYNRLNYDEGSIAASLNLARIYRQQGRLAESVLEGQRLMLRLPKDSQMFKQVEHDTGNINGSILGYEALADMDATDYRLLERMKRWYALLDIDDKRERFSRKLAEAYVLKGKWPQAIAEYREIQQRQPDDATLPKILADLEERQRLTPVEIPTMSHVPWPGHQREGDSR
jgi:serine/threonine protein kinase